MKSYCTELQQEQYGRNSSQVPLPFPIFFNLQLLLQPQFCSLLFKEKIDANKTHSKTISGI